MAKKKSTGDELVFVPLGGVGEIGRNMGLYGFGPADDRKWLVVDCGVSFGGPETPGVELVMPDPTFIEEEADNVVGLVLTHAHEDHYGAVLDLWPGFDKPVFATPFAAAMLRAKRISNAIEDDVDVEIFAPTPVSRRALHDRGHRHSSLDPGKLRPVDRNACRTRPATGDGRSIRRRWERPPPISRLALGMRQPLAGLRLTSMKRASALPRGRPPSSLIIPQNRVAVTIFISISAVISIAALRKADRQMSPQGSCHVIGCYEQR